MRLRHLIFAVVAGAVTLSSLAPAYADRDDRHRRDDRRHEAYEHRDWDRGDYAPPVVVTPPAYYAPPPVYYAPPPVYYGSPGISFGINIR